MVISCAEAVHSVQMLSLGQTQDPLTGPAGADMATVLVGPADRGDGYRKSPFGHLGPPHIYCVCPPS